MRNSAKKIAFIATVVLIISFANANAGEYFVHGLTGYGNYYLNGDEWSALTTGAEFGVQGSDELSFQFVIEYTPVDLTDYYFALCSARYRFVKADFFMEPSLELGGGILYPIGDKSDVDGVVSGGAGLLYRTHVGIEFGPKVESILVFAGSERGLMLNGLLTVGYRF